MAKNLIFKSKSRENPSDKINFPGLYITEIKYLEADP